MDTEFYFLLVDHLVLRGCEKTSKNDNNLKILLYLMGEGVIYIRWRAEITDFSSPSLIEFGSVYPKLLSFENHYLHGYPFTTVVEDSSAG